METVTCLHGFSQAGDSWDETRSLVRGGYRWLAPDVRATTLAAAATVTTITVVATAVAQIGAELHAHIATPAGCF